MLYCVVAVVVVVFSHSDPEIAAAARERKRQIEMQMRANRDAGYAPDGQSQLRSQVIIILRGGLVCGFSSDEKPK